MIPPEAPETQPGNMPPAASVCLDLIKTRSDFLKAARASHIRASSMTVQARKRRDGTLTCRVGYTCSKKVGNAVARNRAKRRLRAAARQVLPGMGRAGWDYVLIGRAGVTATQPFETLCQDLANAVQRLHARS